MPALLIRISTPPEPFHGGLDQLFAIRQAGDVAALHEDRCSQTFGFLPQCFQLFQTGGTGNQGDTLAGQPDCRRPPYALAGTGDQGNLAV
jgi:hypothetical protein